MTENKVSLKKETDTTGYYREKREKRCQAGVCNSKDQQESLNITIYRSLILEFIIKTNKKYIVTIKRFSTKVM